MDTMRVQVIVGQRVRKPSGSEVVYAPGTYELPADFAQALIDKRHAVPDGEDPGAYFAKLDAEAKALAEAAAAAEE